MIWKTDTEQYITERVNNIVFVDNERPVVITGSLDGVDNTYEMGHNHFIFVVETEPDYGFTDSEEYYLETKERTGE